MKDSNLIVREATVCPYRFSDRPGAMIDFLELLGLSVTLRRHDYAVLQGRGGRVAVHPVSTAATSGGPRTSLAFDVPDAVTAVERLTAAGWSATWWDEAFGRQAWVESPIGKIALNAEMDDFHGYQVGEAEPEPIDVTLVAFTDDLQAATDFFVSLGFRAAAGEASGWRPLRAGSSAGIVGVHHAPDQEVDDDGYAVGNVAFETREALEPLAARLRAAGHPVENCTAATEPPTDILAVIDPDGVRVEIHPASH